MRKGLNSIISEADFEARRRKAAEMILESEIVTASLEHDEADWLRTRML